MVENGNNKQELFDLIVIGTGTAASVRHRNAVLQDGRWL